MKPTDKPKTPAFYLRVSTTAQEFSSQLHAIREFCRRKGWPLPGAKNLFSEKASGVKAKRAELDRMMQAVRDGKFDSVITYRVDRMGRSMPHVVNVFYELDRIGIRMIGVKDSFDSADDTPQSRMVRNMMASVAEMHRELIVENTREGLAAAAKEGRFGGRPRGKDAAIVKAKKLRAQGKTLQEIRAKTGLSVGYLSDIFSGKRKASK